MLMRFARQASVWRTMACGLAVVVVATSFQLRYLPVPYPSDQINYVDGALDFPDPSPGVPVHQFTRYGLLLPIRLCVELFGYSPTAYYAVPMLAGTALALAVFVLGRLLFSRTVGVVAAAATVANNVVAYDLTQPMPDVLATALLTSAVALTVAIRWELPAVTGTGCRRIVALVGLGVLLGWAYLTREYTVLIWPLVAGLLVRRIGWRGLLAVAAPLALTAVAELALSAWTYGDPLTRVRAVVGHGGAGAEHSDDIAAAYQGMPRGWYLTRLTDGLTAVSGGGWLLLALAGTVVGGVLAWRRIGPLLVWVALLYVPLVALGGALDPSAPRLPLDLMRYWFPIFPAFVLGGVAAVWLLSLWIARRISPGISPGIPPGVPPLRSRSGGLAALVVVVVGGAALIAAAPAWNESTGYRVVGPNRLTEFGEWLGEHRGTVRVVWADERTVRVLPMYLGDSGDTVRPVRLATMRPTGPRPRAGDHVVLYGSRSGRTPCAHCRMAAESVLGKPIRARAYWTPVYASPDRQLLIYRLDRR